MVSVTILSICLTLVLSSFMRSLRAIELSEDYFRAGLLFGEKAYEIYGSEAEEGSDSGVFPDFDNKFSWDLDVKGLEDSFLKEAELRVFWGEGNKEQDIFIPMYL